MLVLCHPSSQNGIEEYVDLQNLPATAPVLVYRAKRKSWEGPFNFICAERENFISQVVTGRNMFRSILFQQCIKWQFGRKNKRETVQEQVIIIFTIVYRIDYLGHVWLEGMAQKSIYEIVE